jgi:hypothetical protein
VCACINRRLTPLGSPAMESAMASALRLVLLSVPLMCMSGCSWLPYLGRNLAGTPLEVVAHCRFKVEMCGHANDAWRGVVAHDPEQHFSTAYADGFHRGFIDYVERGGNGEPPAMPPMCYRYPVLRSPEQQQAIDDWFAGFRHGSTIAREQGWRNGVIVPIGRPPDYVPVEFKQEIVPTPGALPAPTPTPVEELPRPRLDPEPLMWLGPPVPHFTEPDRLQALLRY